MTKQDVLQAFFDAYEALQSLPKKKGAPGPEKKAAMELLDLKAAAVRNWTIEPVAAPIDVTRVEYLSLAHQVAAIPPEDTRGRDKNQPQIVKMMR